MTASKPVTIITDADLSNGRFVLEGRTAVRVSQFTGGATQGGAATAVYVVTQAQVDAGDFVVSGNYPVQIVEITGRATKQNGAIPVFVESI